MRLKLRVAQVTSTGGEPTEIVADGPYGLRVSFRQDAHTVGSSNLVVSNLVVGIPRAIPTTYGAEFEIEIFDAGAKP